MKKLKAKIVTSLEFVGTDIKFEDIQYVVVPDKDGTLAFMIIEQVGKRVRVIKTAGYLGDFEEGHRFDCKIHRPDDLEAPNEIHTASGKVHKVTKYNVIKGDSFNYILDVMDDGDTRVIHSESFLGNWKHTDIQGLLFTREVQS